MQELLLFLCSSICKVDKVTIRRRRSRRRHDVQIRKQSERWKCLWLVGTDSRLCKVVFLLGRYPFCIKPQCIITVRVSGILHCCLISQLMLLLGAANLHLSCLSSLSLFIRIEKLSIFIMGGDNTPRLFTQLIKS